MGNAFFAGLKNEAPRGRDITNEDRNSEVSQRGTQRDAEGSEFSYTTHEDTALSSSEATKKTFILNSALVSLRWCELRAMCKWRRTVVKSGSSGSVMSSHQTVSDYTLRQCF